VHWKKTLLCFWIIQVPLIKQSILYYYLSCSWVLCRGRIEKNIISSIHRDNVIRELVKYQANALIVNIDDYHNIHGLRIPTTMSTSTVAHMTTVLAIPISIASAIPQSVGDANIHNPRLVDSSVLITQIENRFMALLSQLFNDRTYEINIFWSANHTNVW